MRLLLTAFEPFGGDDQNAALTVMELLPERIGTIDIDRCVLPVSFRRAFPALREAIGTYGPDAVLCLGQAKGRRGITPERVALNFDDARMPDNDGECPEEQRIREDGETAYFTTMPVRSMCWAIQLAHLPAAVSTSAGTFVCNHVFYELMHYTAVNRLGWKAGFLHVPCTPDQAEDRPDIFTMPAEDIARGVTLAIRCLEDN